MRLTELQDGTTLYLHDEGEALSDAIIRDRDYFEREILDYIRENYPIHECIIDVGANIGNHTVYFATYLQYKTIVCFEPITDNFNLLKKNTEDFGSIWLRHYAVGEYDGPIRMRINRGNMGACEVNPDGEIKVPQIQLDNTLVPSVTLIKIDVEWHEPEVLHGARQLIAEDKPLILIEDANSEYRSLLPDYYRLLKAWPEHKTYLYGVPHHGA